MTSRSRITADELTRAYEEIDYSPHPTDPDTFHRPGEELFFFHTSYQGEYYWAFVLEDVENTEEMFGRKGEFSRPLMAKLGEILDP